MARENDEDAKSGFDITVGRTYLKRAQWRLSRTKGMEKFFPLNHHHMEALRKRFSQDPSFLNEAAMGLQTCEANPTGRAGPIPDYPVGSQFASRADCAVARVHGKTVAGIHGTKKYGAYSICVSGGYGDDIDEGDFIIYTGAGGQSLKGERTFEPGPQKCDQSFEHSDNAALAKNVLTQRPVRVIRGSNADSPWAPETKYDRHSGKRLPPNYRYDGLYTVERAYLDKGVDGFQICRFELRRLPGQPPIPLRPTYAVDL